MTATTLLLALAFAPAQAQQTAPAPAVSPPAAASEPQCQTIGGTTYCKDGTRFDPTQGGTAGAASAADGKPAVQNIGRSGPTQYQVDNTRIFGVDDRIRRLGETNFRTGQQESFGASSGRNCFTFNTSVFCD